MIQHQIDDVKVEHVWVFDRPDMRIQFDVAVSLSLIIPEADHHYDDYEEKTIWLMLHCEGDLDKELEDMTIFETSAYNGKNRDKKPLDDSLVPVFGNEQLDEIAEDFLCRHYKKALLEPCWVNPVELAEGMELTVRRQRITEDGSVFGRSYFQECESEVYDEDIRAQHRCGCIKYHRNGSPCLPCGKCGLFAFRILVFDYIGTL